MGDIFTQLAKSCAIITRIYETSGLSVPDFFVP